MKLAAVNLSHLVIATVHCLIAISQNCDLGPSDVLFVLQAGHDINNNDFDDSRKAIGQIVEDFDIGPSKKVNTPQSLQT
ncbi:unnamed protein product [Dracunculus medinensis]|uniref:ANK_REP_REGION domain-containing protein n=1 Tax=Dracunculus medinensis TaxID=318479 RepID=A0A0N4UNN4_DRAME|nr:unnamed protein product [Dracunculus medinensis]